MSADDDIAADFLVEAREIADRLGEELVALEQNPTDPDLLNAVFRGFHTIKGGAGFLNFTALVEACHAVEEAFGVVRSGKREGDAELFDGAWPCAFSNRARAVPNLHCRRCRAYRTSARGRWPARSWNLRTCRP